MNVVVLCDICLGGLMETEPVHESVCFNNLQLLSAPEQFTEYGCPVVLPYKEHNGTVRVVALT